MLQCTGTQNDMKTLNKYDTKHLLRPSGKKMIHICNLSRYDNKNNATSGPLFYEKNISILHELGADMNTTAEMVESNHCN